jgi:hypothetical protein
VERVDDVCLAEIRLDGCVGRSNLEVDHDAVYIGDYAVDEAIVPDLGLAHLNGEGGDPVVDKGGFDGAGLTRVDLQGIGL